MWISWFAHVVFMVELALRDTSFEKTCRWRPHNSEGKHGLVQMENIQCVDYMPVVTRYRIFCLSKSWIYEYKHHYIIIVLQINFHPVISFDIKNYLWEWVLFRITWPLILDDVATPLGRLACFTPLALSCFLLINFLFLWSIYSHFCLHTERKK